MEQVVLVNDNDEPVGLLPKESVHTKDTPLHRGFSLFLLNGKNELLLTRRALGKKTFPGVWTNSVCGHPGPGESYENAAKRRLADELGYVDVDVTVVGPYRYRFADGNGIVENEICPVLVARTDKDPVVNPEESMSWKWIPWHDFLADISTHPDIYSPWCREEAVIVNRKI